MSEYLTTYVRIWLVNTGGVAVGTVAQFTHPDGPWTDEVSLPCDGRNVNLADWPDYAAMLSTHTRFHGHPLRRPRAYVRWLRYGTLFGGDSRTPWERLRGVPQRTANLPDLRGKLLCDGSTIPRSKFRALYAALDVLLGS